MQFKRFQQLEQGRFCERHPEILRIKRRNSFLSSSRLRNHALRPSHIEPFRRRRSAASARRRAADARMHACGRAHRRSAFLMRVHDGFRRRDLLLIVFHPLLFFPLFHLCLNAINNYQFEY